MVRELVSARATPLVTGVSGRRSRESCLQTCTSHGGDSPCPVGWLLRALLFKITIDLGHVEGRLRIAYKLAGSPCYMYS